MIDGKPGGAGGGVQSVAAPEDRDRERFGSEVERVAERNDDRGDADINVKKGRDPERSGEPLIAWCYLGSVGGGWWG